MILISVLIIIKSIKHRRTYTEAQVSTPREVASVPAAAASHGCLHGTIRSEQPLLEEL